MVGNLTTALRAAQSGLLTTQNAVTTSANNIANVNTEGYSRKIINFEQRVLAGAGAGVQLSDFTRAVDEGLLKDLRRELSQLNKLESQVSYYSRLQVEFGSPEANNSISHILNSFSQSAEALAVSPEKTLELNEFVRFANEEADGKEQDRLGHQLIGEDIERAELAEKKDGNQVEAGRAKRREQSGDRTSSPRHQKHDDPVGVGMRFQGAKRSFVEQMFASNDQTEEGHGLADDLEPRRAGGRSTLLLWFQKRHVTPN